MQNNLSKDEVTRNFKRADAAWQTELNRVFGAKEGGQARYEKRGRGDAGTELRLAYEWRRDAAEAYNAVMGGKII